MTLLYLLLGTFFGFVLSRSGAADYDFIQGMFLFQRVQLYGIIGTAEQCAEQLHRYIEAGCTYFVLDAICDAADEARQIEMFAAELLPRFRSR